jgi:hypothetical protein
MASCWCAGRAARGRPKAAARCSCCPPAHQLGLGDHEAVALPHVAERRQHRVEDEVQRDAPGGGEGRGLDMTALRRILHRRALGPLPPRLSRRHRPPVVRELARPKVRVDRTEHPAGREGGRRGGQRACKAVGASALASTAAFEARDAAGRPQSYSCRGARGGLPRAGRGSVGAVPARPGTPAHAAAPRTILTLLIRWSSMYPASRMTCGTAPGWAQGCGGGAARGRGGGVAVAAGSQWRRGAVAAGSQQRGAARRACAAAAARAPRRGPCPLLQLPARLRAPTGPPATPLTSAAALSSLCFTPAASFRSVCCGFGSGDSSAASARLNLMAAARADMLLPLPIWAKGGWGRGRGVWGRTEAARSRLALQANRGMAPAVVRRREWARLRSGSGAGAMRARERQRGVRGVQARRARRTGAHERLHLHPAGTAGTGHTQPAGGRVGAHL